MPRRGRRARRRGGVASARGARRRAKRRSRVRGSARATRTTTTAALAEQKGPARARACATWWAERTRSARETRRVRAETQLGVLELLRKSRSVVASSEGRTRETRAVNVDLRIGRTRRELLGAFGRVAAIEVRRESRGEARRGGRAHGDEGSRRYSGVRGDEGAAHAQEVTRAGRSVRRGVHGRGASSGTVSPSKRAV